MKNLLFLFILSFASIPSFSQTDVTTFLGIPVDGFKSEMRRQIIAKGFTPNNSTSTEFFEGEFNGTDVHVYIATNNNKVYRIMLCDTNTQNEAGIKIRFNRLVQQFQKNQRYTTLEDYTIGDDEDISYEMTVNAKNYDALFYQLPDMSKVDTLALQSRVREKILEKYTLEQLEDPNEEIQQYSESVAALEAMDLIFKKPVWFRICEHYGEYYITMFYDNEYNHADGEDL